jgi:hypothetical protein
MPYFLKKLAPANKLVSKAQARAHCIGQGVVGLGWVQRWPETDPKPYDALMNH